MGLLSKLDRFLPDEQVIGLLRQAGPVGHGLLNIIGVHDQDPMAGYRPGDVQSTPLAAPPSQPQPADDPISRGLLGLGINTPTAAPRAPTAAPVADKGPGALRYISGFLGGQTADETRDNYDARQTGKANAAELARLRASQLTDPYEKLTYYTDPKAWAGKTAERYGVRNTPAGDTASFGVPGSRNFQGFQADKFGQAGDEIFNQTADGVDLQGRRSQTYAETETSRDNREKNRTAALNALLEGRKVDQQGQHYERSDKTDRDRIEAGVDPNNVVAPIMRKIAAGGTLSAGEQKVYDDYQARKVDPMEAFLQSLGKLPPGAPAVPGAAPALPGVSQGPAQQRQPVLKAAPPPVAPKTVPEGGVVVQNGKRYQNKGGRMVEVP